jgi:glycosyltransferase involved in cell wall biosynthesis
MVTAERTENGGTRVAYILRSYPRLSQTFILNEILALERLGLTIDVYGMTRPNEDSLVQDRLTEVKASPTYLDAGRARASALAEHVLVAASSPRRYLRALAYVTRRRDLDKGYVTRSRFACFDHAVHLARILRPNRSRAGDSIQRVHSHFAHDPTLIALLLKRLTGMPYSFSAHARDLYQTRPRAVTERLHEASAVVTCCRTNLEYLSRLAPEAGRKLHLIHHGIDLETFHPPADAPARAVPLVVAVGRLVEKKGFDDLLEACRIVKDRGHVFRLVVYGDGPLRDDLVAAALRLGLDNQVSFAGARTQGEILDALQEADVFALTPCVTDDGDRDGIPNALVEAMACGLPVVSTAVGGVTEVVIHDRTGLLADPHDVPAIAGHLVSLLLDRSRRRRLGRNAREAIVESFDAAENVRRLAAVLGAEEERCAP